MKNILMVLLLALGCAGCAAFPNSVVPAAVPVQPVDRVTLGMTRAAVAAIMAARVVMGYEIDAQRATSVPLETSNLYSSEAVTVNGVDYQVDRYIVRPSVPGGRLASADLFPVVYKAGLVAAKGRDGSAALGIK